jgi:hypothetical protein
MDGSIENEESYDDDSEEEGNLAMLDGLRMRDSNLASKTKSNYQGRWKIFEKFITNNYPDAIAADATVANRVLHSRITPYCY